MMEEYWLKCGFKKNGDLICVRTLPNAEPSETFFYSEGGGNVTVENPKVVKLTKEKFRKLLGED
jgi:hypothetical protein